MLCPECQYPNPDNNKFCGNCGSKLPVTQYPRAGYDEAEVPPVMPVAPDLVERSTPPSEARVRERVPVTEVPVIKEPVRDEPTPVSADSARKTTNFFDLAPAEEPHTTSRSSLSGPSFLGLDETPYDYEEDRPRSHALRNWVLFFFALVAVLASAEWRNIRDTGLRFAGTMQMKLPNKNGNPPAQTPVPPPPDTTASQPNPNGPDLLVAPTKNGSSPAQNATPGSEGAQAGTTEKNSPPNAKADSNKVPDSQPNPNPDKNQAAADTNKPAEEPTGDSHGQKLEKANEEPSPAEKAAESKNSEASSDTPAPKPTKKAKAEVAAKPKVEPGEAELNQAYSTSNPEQKAKYLWDATSKGNTDASYLLADMYASGKGVRQNCEQARVLLDSAARRGNPRAQARLGMYYATGRCVKQDRAQAWQWLSRAHQANPGSDWMNQYRKQLLSEMTDQERARAGISTSAASE